MSRPPNFDRSQSNVTDWLDGQHGYMSPDESDKGTKSYPYVRPGRFQPATPTASEESSSRGKNDNSPREPRPSRRHDRPLTPPSEDDMDRARARDREQRRSARKSSHSASRARNHDDTDHRAPREHKETRYPPRTDRGRPPRRPPMKTASTTPDFREDKEDKRQRHRRHSNSASPPRVRDDKSSRHYHRHRSDEDDVVVRSSRGHRDHRDSRDARTHYSGSSKASATHSSSAKVRGHKEPVPAPAAAAAGAAPKSRRSSFAFLSDPRFATAAQAALTAGVSAAVGAVGQPNAGAKVAQAALGAAAMGALRSPGPEKENVKSSDLGRRDSRRKR